MSGQANVVEAVVTACPSEIYEQVGDPSGLSWDRDMEAWIAVDADTVQTVLSHPELAVRPPDAPVPPLLAGRFAGDIFGRFARMSDGDRHRERRALAQSVLDDMTPEQVARATRTVLHRLGDELTSHDLQFSVPVMTVGTLLGVREERWRDLVDWTSAFVRAAAPGASRDDAETASQAGQEMVRVFSVRPGPESSTPELETDRIVNTIGLLFQTYDATAGLVGNALVALARNRDGDIDQSFEKVLRADAPVQNTRRWAISDFRLGDQQVRKGDLVIAVLGGPADDCRFGSGPHRCPGESVAMTIAHEIVRFARDTGLVPDEARGAVRYHPSGNARIPDLRSIMTPEGTP